MQQNEFIKSTRAALPGRIAVKPLVWVRCHPKHWTPRLIKIALLTVFAVVIVAGSRGTAWPLLVPVGILIFAILRPVCLDIIAMRDWFERGNLNAGKVVSVAPYLVAVCGDLSLQTGESWPVIKIVEQPLENVRGSLKIGDRVPTVALYFGGSPGKPHWDDLRPVAAQCVTDDERMIRDALWRIGHDGGGDAWAELDYYLALVPRPLQPGLYWMRSHQEP